MISIVSTPKKGYPIVVNYSLHPQVVTIEMPLGSTQGDIQLNQSHRIANGQGGRMMQRLPARHLLLVSTRYKPAHCRISMRRLEQYHNRAATAVDRTSLDKRQDFLPLGQPMPDVVLEDRFAIYRAQALAMNDAHATRATPFAFMEEIGQFQFGFRPGQAMEIEFRLGDPLAPAQAPQGLARQPGSEEGEFLAIFGVFIPANGIVQGSMDDLPFIPEPAQGNGREAGRGVQEATVRSNRFHIGERVPKLRPLCFRQSG